MTRPARKPAVHPDALAEINALPSDVREEVVKILLAVAGYETSGTPLEERGSTGDLSDCYKYYFDPDPNIRPGRYRLVYRLLPNQRVTLVEVQAVAVGLREALAVYHSARNARGVTSRTSSGPNGRNGSRPGGLRTAAADLAADAAAKPPSWNKLGTASRPPGGRGAISPIGQ